MSAPRLSLSTQGGPSSPAPRPRGARKRGGLTPGLFIANPDDTDDASPPASAGSQRSPSRSSPVNGSSSLSQLPTINDDGSPVTNENSRASVPPPLVSTAIPTTVVSEFVSPSHPVPPGARRAFTTPIPEPHPHRDRMTGGSLSGPHPPASPMRALPALPSPPATAPPSIHQSPPSLHPSTPSSVHSQPMLQTARMDSPELLISPSGQSENSSSLGHSMGRIRSGSVSNNKVLLQVTTDNEQFTLVDVTGMNTPDAIRERIFSKVGLNVVVADDSCALVMTIILRFPCFEQRLGSLQTSNP